MNVTTHACLPKKVSGRQKIIDCCSCSSRWLWYCRRDVVWRGVRCAFTLALYFTDQSPLGGRRLHLLYPLSEWLWRIVRPPVIWRGDQPNPTSQEYRTRCTVSVLFMKACFRVDRCLHEPDRHSERRYAEESLTSSDDGPQDRIIRKQKWVNSPAKIIPK